MNYLYQIDYKFLQDFGERVFKSRNETKINFLENLNFSNFDADTIFILVVLVIFFIFLALDKPNKKSKKIILTPKPQINEKSVKEAKKIKHKKKSIKRRSNEISADEVKQKIDLAVAYIEMGEKKNARTTISQLKKFNLSAVEKKLIKDLNKNL
ncbi:MAG: hypothetical protein DBW93_01975 [SAR86 cluster bacterium]|jgi:hypothetical protein|nr:MAG: hypothetical protein DBW93_01975 [SAR86 cluster bacterium]|tara:strand:+ start:542 stop:1003 length:462 start_codon:yes stop_codon:yes gene_type:complete